MIDNNDRLYNKAYDSITEMVSCWWPWTSKRKAWKKSVTALSAYHSSMFEEEMKQAAEKQVEKGKGLHKYRVTIGYEDFPWYFEIRREGDWFLFCHGSKVMTVRHKDEKLDHTIHYRDKVITARDIGEAFQTLEYNSKYHICSFEVEELSEDE